MAVANAYFVRQNGQNNVKVMQRAFEAANSGDDMCQWITEEECMNIKERCRKSAFVFAEFEGHAFQHIANCGNRIYGPGAIFTCFKGGENLPKMPNPVYNMSMKGIVVSCTNLHSDIRALVHQRIIWMCGEVSKAFHDKVTHLIAGEVGSKKYMVAASMKKMIMSAEWVDKVWEDSLTKECHANSEEYLRYRCPIFSGCTITVSGLEPNDRAEIRHMIESNGGTYSGEMKVKECTHVILQLPKGQKYEFAQKWQIPAVHPSWIFDSLDAGYYLDVQKYKIAPAKDDLPTSNKVTSTPSANNSGLFMGPDVSCISVTHINETAMTTMNCTMGRPSEPRPSDPLDDLDLSKIKAGMFLDGCKIYLSGFSGSRLEKIRKVINLGGGTRFSQINETISHVVMGERIESDIRILESGQFRPYVVGLTWVLECARQGTQVQEEDFVALELPHQESMLQNLKLNGNKSMDTTPGSANTSRVKAKSTKRASSGAQGNPGEMMDLLSQYLPGNQDDTDESALLRAVQVAENDQQVPQSTENEDDEATQDPSEESTLREGALFLGKTFTIIGMSIEDATELSAMIEEEGGKILDRKSRTVPDFGVVPLFGCEVTITVSEVVTLPYIQMCIEEHCLFPVSENVLFSPVAIQPDSRPLEACVLSISGYSGTERDCLMYIAETLGAQCQEYFVKQARKGYLASTHLVVNAPCGSKYAAAKKWNLPAVEKKWLLECARTGKLVIEARYCIDRVDDPNDTTIDEGPSVTMPSLPDGAAEGQIKEEISPKTPGYKPVSNMNTPVNPTHKPVGNTNTPVNPTHKSVGNTNTPVNQTHKTVGNMNTPVNQTHKPLGNINTPVTPAHEPVSNMKKPVLEPSKPKPRVMDPPKVSSTPTGRRAPCSDKTNVTGDEGTPNILATKKRAETIKLENQRVRELVQQSKQATPKPLSSESAGVETPGKFLDPNKKYLPKFDTDDLVTALKTPVGQNPQSRKDIDTPLDELFDKCLAQAVKNTSNQGKIPGTPVPHTDPLERTLFPKSGPLKDVVIGVSKKLSAQQSDFNNVAADLGADYRWTFDQSCTHFIFEGRQNDANKEFKQARQLRKHIVSPFWLQVCKEQNAHVDESLFPHTYNPNLALPVTSTKGTPSRLSRRSTRSRQKAEEETSASPVRTTRNRAKSTSSGLSEDKKVKDQAKKTRSSEEDTDGDNVVQTKKDFDNMDKTCSDEEMAEALQNLEDHVPYTQPMNTLARVALVDDLKTLMAATKTDVRGKRRNRRTDSMSTDVSLEEPDAKRVSLSLTSDKSDEYDSSGRSSKERRRSQRSSRSRSSRQEETQSQMPEVTWDDPETRAQQEILAAELAKNSESQSPKHEATSSDEAPSYHRERRSNEGTTHQTEQNQTRKSRGSRTPTPEPPPIAMPTPLAKDRNSLLVKPAEEEEEEEVQFKDSPPYILFSGLSQQERADYGALVEELGGHVIETGHYDPKSTHLIVGTPTRNEKYLACVGTGKWVLHKSFLEACRHANAFVDERDHEWGSPATADILAKSKHSSMVKLAKAAFRWRQQLNNGEGAFSGWKCLLMTEEKREGGFRRLLEAGGATVLREVPDMSILERDVNYAFIDASKCKIKVDINLLQSAGVHCVKPEYIASYLTEDPLPTPQSFYVPEAKATSSSGEQSRKRKSLYDEVSDSKRSRLQ